MSKNECNPCDIDNSSNIERNITTVSSASQLVLTDQNGSFTIDSIPFLEEQYAASLVENLDTNSYEVLIRRYGNTVVNDLTNNLNTFLRGQFTESYPKLNDRLLLGKPITGIECAQFMEDYLYNPTSIGQAQNSDRQKLLRNLNDFYNGSWIDSIMGGFCGAIGSIYGAAMALFDMIGKIGDLISSALAAINKLKNLKDLAKAAFEKIKVKALIEAIKKKIVDAIKEKWRTVVDAVENFSLDTLISDVENRVKEISDSVRQKIKAEIDRVKEILNDENRDTFLKKVEGLIDYAVERFANPSLKAVELLVYRMCGFAVSVEGLIDGVKERLQQIMDNFKDSAEQTKKASAQATAEAVKAGANRVSDEARKEGINNMAERCRQASRDASTESDNNGGPPTVIETEPLTNQEIDGIPTWEQLLAGPVNNLYINPGSNIATKMGRDAWSDRYVPMQAKVKLMRLAESWGSTLTIISAYRSPKYNKSVRGKSKSLHMKGVAFDVTFSGSGSLQRQFEFVEMAREAGWHAAGFYPNKGFVHVDIGGIIPGYETKRPKGVFVTWPRSTRSTYESWRRNR